MMTYEEMKAKALEDPEIRYHYEHPDADIIELDIRLAARNARKEANLTQAEVAKKMKTSQQAVARLESKSSGKSPSLSTLIKYAEAVGCDLTFNFHPKHS